MSDVELEQLVFQMDANIVRLGKKLDQAISTVDTRAGQIEKRFEQSSAKIEKLFGEINVGEALDKVFSRARLGVIEEGATKIGIFGSALEALGPIGVGAGAGLAAVGAAMELAKGAAEYAEEISNSATKLGVTTKALQEYNFVALASGVSTDTLRESIEKGNAAIGALQSGVGGDRMTKAFEGLKISPEEAKGWNNILDALPTISERINNLGTVAEKTQIAKRLGIEGILPIIMKGKEGIDELRSEAESAGAVLDTDMIAKGKEAAEKMKEASSEVDLNLKRAFIGLAPYIAACVELIGKIAKGIADAVEAFGPISSWSRVHVNDQLADERKAQGVLRPLAGNVDRNGRATGGVLSWAWNNHQNTIDQLSARGSELDKMDAAAAKAAKGTAGAPLVADKPKADHANEDSKAAQEAADEAAKELAQARAALTQDVYKHAEFEKQAIDDETKKKNDALAAATAKIEADKTLTAAKKEQLRVENGLTAAANTIAGALKKQAIDMKAAEDSDKLWLATQAAIASDYRAIAQISAALAHSMAERRTILQKDQRDNQREDYAKLSNDLGWQVVGHHIPQGSMDAQLASRRDLYAAQDKDLDKKTQSPFAQWADSGMHSAAQVGEALQSEAVKGITDFNTQLAASIVNGKNFGDSFRSILKSIESDIIQLLLKQAEIGIFGGAPGTPNNSGAGGGILSFGASLMHLIPGFATGTDNAPGGLALVGENGPELVNLSRGSQVVPNGVLRSLAGASARALGTPSTNQVHQHFTLHAPGAMMFPDFVDQVNSSIRQMGAAAAMSGAQGGHKLTMEKLSSQSRNRIK